MGLSKLSEKCRKCPKRDKCNHKKMEAMAYLRPCGKTAGEKASQPIVRETMQINVGGILQTVYKDDIAKAIERELFKDRFIHFGA